MLMSPSVAGLVIICHNNLLIQFSPETRYLVRLGEFWILFLNNLTRILMSAQNTNSYIFTIFPIKVSTPGGLVLDFKRYISVSVDPTYMEGGT